MARLVLEEVVRGLATPQEGEAAHVEARRAGLRLALRPVRRPETWFPSVAWILTFSIDRKVEWMARFKSARIPLAIKIRSPMPTITQDIGRMKFPSRGRPGRCRTGRPAR